jgi:hypothetical protein
VQTDLQSIPLPWSTIAPQDDARAPDFADLRSKIATLPKQLSNSPVGGGAFTIPLICLGISLIAMCLLIPAADENRKLAYERERLKTDLEQLQLQVSTNDAFLKRVANDPTLAERLARRQMKMVPQGTAVMDLKGTRSSHEMSPFLLVTIPPPAPMAPYRPIGGFLANACRYPKTQLYIIGASLLMIASGLVMSRSSGNVELDDGVTADQWESPGSAALRPGA